MQFQQKLQKMQDQKRNELISPTSGGGGYYRTTTTSTTTSSTNGNNGGTGAGNGNGGKVRQLFEERRQQRGIGIDKSYPLQPIQTSSTSSSTTTTTTNNKRTSTLDNHRPAAHLSQRQTPFGTTSTRTVTRSLPGGGHQTTTTRMTTSKFGSSGATAAGDTNNNFDATDFGEHYPRNGGGAGGLNGKLASLSISSEINNNNGHHPAGSIKLKPVNLSSTSSSTPATSSLGTRTVINGAGVGSGGPAAAVTRRTITTTTSTAMNNNGDLVNNPTVSTLSSPFGGAPPRQPPRMISPIKTTTTTVKSATKITPVKKPSGPPPENMAECRICGRYFNEDRVAKHETICEKSKNKKRKVFDTTKHRVKGTDAESYVAKKGRSTGTTTTTKTIAGVVVKQQPDAKKGNWRKKHEEFIAAIRAAKEMKAHLARGGKLSDLPPPPPSENLDYIQCPHCNRRFNEAAATRHIPKCATMLHNKPKAAAAPKRRF